MFLYLCIASFVEVKKSERRRGAERVESRKLRLEKSGHRFRFCGWPAYHFLFNDFLTVSARLAWISEIRN